MNDLMPEMNSRLKEIINFHTDGNVKKFAGLIEFSQQKLNRLFSKDTRTGKFPSITTDIIVKITEKFVYIDLDWLLTGKGEMFRSQNPDKSKQLFQEFYKTKNTKNVTKENGNKKGNIFGTKPKVQKMSSMETAQLPANTKETKEKKGEVKSFAFFSDRNVEHQRIPLYNIEASAGLVPLFADPNTQTPIDYIQIPNLPPCDGAVHVTGDSMYPILKSGDIILYKKINDFLNNIFWGEMYLLSVASDDDEFITLKYIQKSEQGKEFVKLVSHNTHHQPRDIEVNRIRALAFVKASVRMNTMG